MTHKQSHKNPPQEKFPYRSDEEIIRSLTIEFARFTDKLRLERCANGACRRAGRCRNPGADCEGED